jgi:hypothetical protein
MKLGIMQPYFFPYLGYFDLINRVDKWVVFDSVRYSPKTWMNRNRVLHPKSGWQYLSVPVDKHSGDGSLSNVKLIDKTKALSRILGQIEHYRNGGAPFFRETFNLIHEVFRRTHSSTLTELNVAGLECVCDYLGIQFNYQLFSKMELNLPVVSHSGQWALEIADSLDAEEYINPPGGRQIFRPQEWIERKIKLTFTDLVDYRYICGKYVQVDHLSILDVLMWNKPENIKAYLDSRR